MAIRDDFAPGEILTAADLNDTFSSKANETVSITAATADYTLALTDASKLVTVNSASAATVTVPPNTSVALTVGAAIAVAQTGAGQVAIAAGSGVTINSTAGTAPKLTDQYAGAQCYKTATDTWLVIGSIE